MTINWGHSEAQIVPGSRIQLMRHQFLPTNHSGGLPLLQLLRAAYHRGDALLGILFTLAAIETLQLVLRWRPQVAPLIATITPEK